MMKIFTFILCYVYFLQRGEGSGLSNIQTNNECMNPDNIKGIEQCKLCTQKNTTQITTVNRKCFRDGVSERFMYCSNELDDYDYDCDWEKNSTIVETHVTILPPTTERENHALQNWTCYFDITYGQNNAEYVTRLYVSNDSGCSNSTTFIIGKLKPNHPFGRQSSKLNVQYAIYSKAISGNDINLDILIH